jgi:DNA-binding response OmpR family regulator
MRLLLVEDNRSLADLITGGLKRAGFAVDNFASAGEAEEALRAVTYDLLILDLGLPDRDGTLLLQNLRKQGINTPVIIVTARGSVDDRVAGLNIGADDYLVKPFEMDELIARCRAQLRRPGGRSSVALAAGNVSVDTVTGEVRINDEVIDIGRREYDILVLLLRQSGRVVPKARFEEALYGFGEEVTPNAIEAHVSRLRKRLTAATATPAIHTIRGVGYLLKA